MEKIKYIEHPSDVGFEVSGGTLEELFSNAALALYSFMTDVDGIDITLEREIKIESEDLLSLMFDWIDELLFYFESESIVFKEFDIKIENFTLGGRCAGGIFDPEKHGSGIIIKAVTYHMMEVKKNDRWIARVILDV